MRKLLLAVTVLMTVLTGCSSTPEPPPPPPRVDFTVDAKKVTAKPFLYCDIDIEDCRKDTAAMIKLTVPAGTAVRVTVPREVADTPWSVVIQYRTAAGEQKEPETVATFAPGKETTFEALPPGAGDQLEIIEVKQAGGKLLRGDSGPEAVTRAVWSAQITAS